MAKIGTREDWLKARIELLAAEKELTRKSDELAKRRRRLPWVRIEKDYLFDTDKGKQTLRDLFEGRSQLLIYHFMLGPNMQAGCPVCTIHAESFSRAIPHLNQRDVTMLCVSRGPLERINEYKKRMNFDFRWVSSGRSDFNFDFHVSRPDGADPETLAYNFTEKWSRFNIEEHAGLSAFALEGGEVYHTYTCHARGLEEFNVTYQLLDRVPYGRNEDGFRFPAQWIRRQDEYQAAGP
jgi:predicted dithiol-disulfide oxidoreductase (DUF899 family)